MLSFRIAVRFLRKSPVQTILIILGIAVGISVQIFIGSLISSLQGYLIQQTLGSRPHLTIVSSKEGSPVTVTSTDLSQIRKTQYVSAVAPQRTVSAIYIRQSKSTPLSITCGKPIPLNSIYKLRKKLVKGSYTLNDNEIIIGKELANSYGLSPGDRIKLTLPGGATKELKISGIFDLGSKQLNLNSAFADSRFGQDALGLKTDEYSAVDIQLSDVFKSKEVAKKLTDVVPGSTVSDWQVEQKDLLSGLNAQSISTIMIEFFVIVAVALGIASTLSISAIQKTRQIGILKALGLTDGRSGLVFLFEGLLLGVIGTTAGVLLGLGLIWVFQQVSRSSSSSLFPIKAQFSFIALSAAIGIAVAIFSSILPSRRTARLDPIEVIQSGG